MRVAGIVRRAAPAVLIAVRSPRRREALVRAPQALDLSAIVVLGPLEGSHWDLTRVRLALRAVATARHSTTLPSGHAWPPRVELGVQHRISAAA